MSDLFSNYKNRGGAQVEYNALLRAVHKAWYNGKAFSSEEDIKKLGIFPDESNSVWGYPHQDWTKPRVK